MNKDLKQASEEYFKVLSDYINQEQETMSKSIRHRIYTIHGELNSLINVLQDEDLTKDRYRVETYNDDSQCWHTNEGNIKKSLAEKLNTLYLELGIRSRIVKEE